MDNKLLYFTLYDFHDESQVACAIKEFNDKFIVEYENNLSKTHFNNQNVTITYSKLDLIETLHQSKHEIEGLSQLYFVEHPALNYKDKSILPQSFLSQYKKLEKNDIAQAWGLIGNLMTSNEYRQAACYAYWIVKLKPLIEIEVMNVPTESAAFLNHFKKYLNEDFALYIIVGLIFSAIGKDKSLATLDGKDINNFLHILRYKHVTPEALAVFLELWLRPLIKTR